MSHVVIKSPPWAPPRPLAVEILSE